MAQRKQGQPGGTPPPEPERATAPDFTEVPLGTRRGRSTAGRPPAGDTASTEHRESTTGTEPGCAETGSHPTGGATSTHHGGSSGTDPGCGATGGQQGGTAGTPPAGTGGTGSGGTSSGGTTGGGGQDEQPPDPGQTLKDSWAGSMDSQTAQQFATLTQVRQARSNQLQRQVAAFTTAYGADDPRTVAAQGDLTAEQTFGSSLAIVTAMTSTTAPTAPANGWVVYGRVRNADLSPAPRLTVFLADAKRAWLRQYAFAFTDQTGYFTLSYAPSFTAANTVERSAAASAPPTVNAYLEISNAACKLMYIDAAPMSLPVGAVVYRDIVLSSEVPLGSVPCDQNTPPSTPPSAPPTRGR